ncbi:MULTISPECIES: TniB family NTP-binding protein [unclassified Psychrobacter]|jgi:hypothetical protein|uniref:TniB family NTP-binding protein n=2 Tax=Psychrobacter TaxID=497 RepID=UPI003F9C0DB5|tara:strand:- start:1490 stop:2383 length:894 start_codon:yes stop_codon:yes gene_type:complete
MGSEKKYSHVLDKFQHIVPLSDVDRIHFIDQPRWIGYGKAHRALTIMEGLLSKTKQHRMPNIMIIGDSNNGKTTLINRFFEKFGQEIDDEYYESSIPVILIQAPPVASEKELYIALLERLALPYRSTDATAKLRYQVVHAFLCCNVKLLIIDEIHSLLTGTARQQMQIMNVIKYLCNELKLPIVVAGTSDAIRVLHTDPQHLSRFDVLELENWNNNEEFRRLLGSFERVMPLRKPSELSSPDKARLIHSISDGKIGNVRRLISECAIEAIVTGSEQIDESAIKKRLCKKNTSYRIIE